MVENINVDDKYGYTNGWNSSWRIELNLKP